MENYQLRSQLDLVYHWLNSEKYLSEQIAMLKTLGLNSEMAKKRSEEMKALLQKKTMAALGRVIYRDPSSWSSICWIDAGEENNALLGKTIIAKNSPVISGCALVGVVEYVGKRQSRVRLITDSNLKTAVRAVRGSIAERDISLLAQMLEGRLKKHPFKQTLHQFQQSLKVNWEDGYFAKGEISGTSAPLLSFVAACVKRHWIQLQFCGCRKSCTRSQSCHFAGERSSHYFGTRWHFSTRPSCGKSHPCKATTYRGLFL